MGGNRPSQTDRLARSRRRIHGARLGDRTTKGGISLTAPPRLTPRHLRLPPMLHMDAQPPMPGNSKGSWGLSVLPRASGIFTGITTSPGSALRQRSDRYTFRAGRNLPDKEFRYLRTVIVTAAVYWGFSSMLAHLSLTFQHRAGVRLYTSSFNFAGPCVFSKQSLPPSMCPLPKVAFQ